jgi:hypothetical protein
VQPGLLPATTGSRGVYRSRVYPGVARKRTPALKHKASRGDEVLVLACSPRTLHAHCSTVLPLCQGDHYVMGKNPEKQYRSRQTFRRNRIDTLAAPNRSGRSRWWPNPSRSPGWADQGLPIEASETIGGRTRTGGECRGRAATRNDGLVTNRPGRSTARLVLQRRTQRQCQRVCQRRAAGSSSEVRSREGTL